MADSAHPDAGAIRHHIVVGHPSPASFVHAMASAYCQVAEDNGQPTVIHDLYGAGFDPVLKEKERPGPGYVQAADVAAEFERVRAADVLVLAFPIWFGLPPAIIKGYVDRVLGADFAAANLAAGTPNPGLVGKQLVILSSSATTRPWLEAKGQYSALRHAFDLYLTDIFGMRGAKRVHFDAIVPHTGATYIKQCLEETRRQARIICANLLGERHAAQARAALNRQRQGE
jgi:NAD(P)H dehydrogenase (quinone)